MVAYSRRIDMAKQYDFFDRHDRNRFIRHNWTHSKTGDGFEHIVLTGVVAIHERGESEDHWKREQIDLLIPIPNVPSGKVLRLKHWAPFVTLNAIYKKNMASRNVADNGGYAVDDFKILNTRNGHSQTVTVQTDVAIRDDDSFLYRIGYNVTLIGEFGEP